MVRDWRSRRRRSSINVGDSEVTSEEIQVLVFPCQVFPSFRGAIFGGDWHVSMGKCLHEKFQLDVSSRKSKKRNEPNTQEQIADGQTNSVQAAITSEPEEMFRAIKDLVNECINNSTVTHVIVDCCTSGRAGFSQIGFKFPGLRVVSITKLTPVEQCGFLLKMLKKLVLLKPVLGWFSPPCTGGSKVLNLCPEPRRSEIKDDHREKFLILLPFGVDHFVLYSPSC